MSRFIILFVLIILVALTSFSLAGIPKLINYQGMLTQSDGTTPVNNGNYAILFSIYNTSSEGSSLWSHTYNVSVTNGLFNIILGDSGFPINLPFDTTYWLGIKVGGDAELSPRIRLTSVGYAYRASVADSAVASPPPSTGGGWTDDGAVVRLTTSTDNIGIGTTSPDAPLVISGDGTSWNKGFLYIKNNNNDAGIRLYDKADSVKHHIFNDNGGGDKLRIAPAGSYASGGIAIDQSGNVGIGTTNPQAKLHISGGHIRIDYGGNIYMIQQNGYPSAISKFGNDLQFCNYATGYIDFRTGTSLNSATARLHITNDGNVGIGTTTPGTKLAVYGLTGTTSYNYVKVNTSTGDFYYASSSKRHKEDIRPLEDDFHKILQAEPRSFIDKTSGQREIGYIAEEFDGIGLNNLVIYDKEGQPDGLKYELVSLYLLEIVKELKTENQALKQRIEALEGR